MCKLYFLVRYGYNWDKVLDMNKKKRIVLKFWGEILVKMNYLGEFFFGSEDLSLYKLLYLK